MATHTHTPIHTVLNTFNTQTRKNKPSSTAVTDTFPLEPLKYANMTIYAQAESVHHCASYMSTLHLTSATTEQ